VSGHDFSRAVKVAKTKRALAPARFSTYADACFRSPWKPTLIRRRLQYQVVGVLEFTPLARLLRVRAAAFSHAPPLLPSNLHSPSRRDRGIHPTERGNRGRHQKDRRQDGTQKAQAHGAQKSCAQGQAHHPARLAQEESQEDGPRPVEALRETGVRFHVSVVSFWRSSALSQKCASQ
jgi:hypothetical protein